jgi:hydrogenase/urease accessory protein HupE
VVRAIAAALLLVSTAAAAHPLAPALLEVHEGAAGRIAVGWKTPLLRARGTALEAVLPPTCRDAGPRAVTRDDTGVWTRWPADCGPGGLVGAAFGATGFGATEIAALVRVTLADGRVVRGVVGAARPLVVVPARPSVLDIVRDYLRLGIVHILTGPDHLLFVFGLLLLAGSLRRLLATVTAFTAGHSVTLTLAALGVVHVPSRPIEAAIAASVLALAVELARRPAAPTLIRRRPWTMAATFGLLHGLGFAAALREAGLPEGDVPLALVSFNTGIELGQLAFVVAVLAVAATTRRMRAAVPAWLARVPVYAMGSLAAAWWLERTWAMLR